ncbi:MAG: hypothetical protein AAFV33_14060 [Chloroflexota bacterium]
MTDNALDSNNGAVTETEQTSTEVVTEAVAEAEAPVEAQPEAAPAHAEETDFIYSKPHGAFLFVILMMIFYFVYWTISWLEIFGIRGA